MIKKGSSIKSIKSLYEEYELEIINNGGKTLSQKELHAKGRSNIATAIKTFNLSKRKIEEDLGYIPYEDIRKGNSFFSKEETKNIVLHIYEKFGKGNPVNFQSKKSKTFLKKEKISFFTLSLSIKKWFKSKQKMDICLGFETLQKSWENESLVIKEYDKECRKNGDTALTFKFLSEIGRSDIVNSFRRYSIDKRKLDISLGFEPLSNEILTKDEVAIKFKDLCDKHNSGKPLSYKKLKEIGYGYLNSRIKKYFKSRFELYAFLNIKAPKRDFSNYSFDDYFNDYYTLCEEQGGLPVGEKDLSLLGYSYLNKWISKMIKQGIFKSRRDLHEMCGYVTPQFYRLSNGYYVRSSFEVKFANFLIYNNLLFKVDEIIDDKSRKNYRYDFLLHNISGEPVYVEIWGMENHSIHKFTYKEKQKAKKAFYKRRNLKLINISSNSFEKKSFKDLQEFFKKLLKENNIKLNNFKTLNSAELLKAESESAWTEEKVFNTYKSLCLKNENQPISPSDLKKAGHGGLSLAIFKYYPGGKVQLDKDLGYKNMQSPKFSLDDIKKSMKDLVIANNGVPLFGFELKEMGYRPMVRSISHHYNSSIAEIYTEIGFGKEYEALITRNKGVLSRSKLEFIKENDSKILKDYEEHGRHKAAKIWGVSPSCMGKWVKRLGGVFKREKLVKNKNEVLKDYSELGAKLTAKKYNVYPSTIYRFIKKHKKIILNEN